VNDAARLVALVRQRDFEKLLAVLGDDDLSVRRFATPQQFESDLLGMLQCERGIGKDLADLVSDDPTLK
jgi:hypothetical protein